MLVVAAAGAVLAITLKQFPQEPGASQAFAAALDQIRQARTFSCLRVDETVEEGTRYERKEQFFFKEPYSERTELVSSRFPELGRQVTIHDYQRRQRLVLYPETKEAKRFDYRHSYLVNEETGKIELSQLDTTMRDQLLEWTDRAAEEQSSADRRDSLHRDARE